MKTLKITIQGNVQGVFYRAFAKSNAEKLNITGYVKNLNNSDVEILAEGEPYNLNKFIEILKKGPDGAVITNIIIKEQIYKKQFSEFNIAY